MDKRKLFETVCGPCEAYKMQKQALAEKDALIQEAIEALEEIASSILDQCDPESDGSVSMDYEEMLKLAKQTLQKLRESIDDRSEK